jgi:N,N'-diacetyllegionaminate synthase
MTRIVADACCNHMGDRKVIAEMVYQASLTGVDIIKFQTFKADKLNKNWPDYNTAYEYYKNLELSEDDHKFIIGMCAKYKIKGLFTAFDIECADISRRLWQDEVKIASPDAENMELIRYCSEKFNTVYVSTGMCDLSHIRTLKRFDNVKLFYCISQYPARYEDINFELMQHYDGFSDHTPDIRAAKKAIDQRVPLIERHFTLGKFLPGKDHRFSSTPDEFKELCEYRNYKSKIPLYKERWKG